jgi:hypothetical protein
MFLAMALVNACAIRVVSLDNLGTANVPSAQKKRFDPGQLL